MENKTLLKVTFLSLMLSSCGYLEKFKTPTQPTDSMNASRSSSSEDSDDLESLEIENFVDSSSITSTDDSADLDSQVEDFIVKEQELDVIPKINHQIAQSSMNHKEAGSISHYTVKKGETLMQIAFKIYGDISKWKEIKNLNPNVSSTALTAGSKIKYVTPDMEFSWVPVGTPYLIKSGDTLGTISNEFYSTPAKWKTLWENNKPLIKDPNKIYAGFTVYAKTGAMATQVHPNQGMEIHQVSTKIEGKTEGVEEIAIDQILQNSQKSIEELTSNDVIDEERLVDETFQRLSATQRKSINTIINNESNSGEEIDLINNFQAPSYAEELMPIADDMEILD